MNSASHGEPLHKLQNVFTIIKQSTTRKVVIFTLITNDTCSVAAAGMRRELELFTIHIVSSFVSGGRHIEKNERTKLKTKKTK